MSRTRIVEDNWEKSTKKFELIDGPAERMMDEQQFEGHEGSGRQEEEHGHVRRRGSTRSMSGETNNYLEQKIVETSRGGEE